jgi:hypothetical protein
MLSRFASMMLGAWRSRPGDHANDDDRFAAEQIGDAVLNLHVRVLIGQVGAPADLEMDVAELGAEQRRNGEHGHDDGDAVADDEARVALHHRSRCYRRSFTRGSPSRSLRLATGPVIHHSTLPPEMRRFTATIAWIDADKQAAIAWADAALTDQSTRVPGPSSRRRRRRVSRRGRTFNLVHLPELGAIRMADHQPMGRLRAQAGQRGPGWEVSLPKDLIG